ncbi:ACT domain-containing protein, partial [Bacillus subtilis]|uniref:ACT domain-containing protein n=1 Tax=Bacillus subtilis TaxID=1423 RepID=UPI003C6BDD9D
RVLLFFCDLVSNLQFCILYFFELEILSFFRSFFLNFVLQAVNETKTNISSVSVKSYRNKVATIHMTIFIQKINHLH